MCFGLQHKCENGEKNGDELVKSKFWAEAMGSNSPIGCMLQNYAKGLGLSMKTNQYGRLFGIFLSFFLVHVLLNFHEYISGLTHRSSQKETSFNNICTPGCVT